MSQTKAQLLGPVLGDVNYDSGTLFVDSANNRVGVGTTTMGTKFEVVNTSGNLAASLKCQPAGAATLYFASTSLSDSFIQYDDSGKYWRFFRNGSESLRVNSTGVGIGTNNPATKLQVYGQLTLKQQLYLNDASDNQIFRVTELGASRDVRIDTYNQTDFDGTLRLAASFLSLQTGTGLNVSDRLVINSSGNVGIGTDNPTNKLDVRGSVISVGNGVTNILSYDLNGVVGTTSDHSLGLFTAGTAKVRITTSGNVGIGVTSPLTKLHTQISTTQGVTGTVLDSYPIALFDNKDSNGSIRGLEIGSPTGNVTSPVYLKVSGTASRFAILNQSNSESFTILDGGNVGIGTDLPSAKLHISSNTTTQMMISNISSTMNDGDTIGVLDFAAGPNHTVNARVAGHVEGTDELGGDLVFETRANGGSLLEKVRITSTGEVGIGTDIPPAKLSVTGGAIIFGNTTSSGSGGTLRIVESGNSVYIQPGSNTSNDSSCDLIISSINGVTERLRITSTGNVGIGTNNPVNTLQVGTTASVSSTSPVSISIGGQYTPDASISLSNLKLKIYEASSGDAAGFTVGQSNGLCYVGPATSSHNWYTSDGALNLSLRMHLSNSGNLGIGTNSPGNELTVYKNQASYNTSFAVLNPSTDAGVYSSIYSVAGPVTGQLYTDGQGNDGIQGLTLRTTTNHHLRLGTNNTQRLVITNTGNVGIGITGTNVTDKLFVNDSATNCSIVVRTGGASLTAQTVYNADSTNYASVGIENSNLVFRVEQNSSPAERLRIYQSGVQYRFANVSGDSNTGANTPTFNHMNDILVANGNGNGVYRRSFLARSKNQAQRYSYWAIGWDGASYDGTGSAKIRITWGTAHASGAGFTELNFAVRSNSNQYPPVVAGAVVAQPVQYSGGWFYGWTSAPDWHIYQCNSGENFDYLILRLDGYGNYNSGQWNLGLVEEVYLETWGPAFRGLYHLGFSAPSGFTLNAATKYTM